MALTTFRSTAAWTGKGLLCQGESRGFKVYMDEPEFLGGTDKAMNPVELLLCCLGGCISISAAAFAPSCRVDLQAVSVELEGDLDPDGFTGKNPAVRKGFQQIRFRLNITSPSPQGNIDRLVKLIEERCPVADTLKGVQIIHTID